MKQLNLFHRNVRIIPERAALKKKKQQERRQQYLKEIGRREPISLRELDIILRSK
jgi:hypothetical protein